MPINREHPLSQHFLLKDLLVDATFPELALALAPDDTVMMNLARLTELIERIVERFPPRWEVLSGYRDERLNEACRKAGMPASVNSLHLRGCAADIRPVSEDVDLELVFDWIQEASKEALPVHEAVYYPNKGFIHVAVQDRDHPTAKRILMRT